MAYKYDEDLEFLREMSSEDLNDLVEALVWRDGGEILTGTLSDDSLYKEHYPDHEKYLDRIMEEIQRFGGNTFANVFRGHGVLYKEIVRDVAKKLKVKYDKEASTPEIEMEIYLKIFSDVVEKMSEEEKEKLLSELRQGVVDSVKDSGYKHPTDIREIVGNVSKLRKVQGYAQSVLRLTQYIAEGSIGSPMKAQIFKIIADFVWKTVFKHSVGSAIAAGAGGTAVVVLGRVASVLTGPVGLAIGGVWTAVSLAGPAYRVTVPVVIQVAYLRIVLEQRRSEEEPPRRTGYVGCLVVLAGIVALAYGILKFYYDV